MKTCKSAVEMGKLNEELIAIIKQREQLRNEKNAFARKKNVIRQRLYTAIKNDDRQKTEYLSTLIGSFDVAIDEKTAEIKSLSTKIRSIRALTRYYKSNERDLTPKESTLCYKMFGKSYRELTKTEKSSYEKALRKQKNRSGQ